MGGFKQEGVLWAIGTQHHWRSKPGIPCSQSKDSDMSSSESHVSALAGITAFCDRRSSASSITAVWPRVLSNFMIVHISRGNNSHHSNSSWTQQIQNTSYSEQTQLTHCYRTTSISSNTTGSLHFTTAAVMVDFIFSSFRSWSAGWYLIILV